MRTWSRAQGGYRYLRNKRGPLFGVSQWPDEAYPVIWVYREGTTTQDDIVHLWGFPEPHKRMMAAQCLAYFLTYGKPEAGA